jgi:hypothetical protein
MKALSPYNQCREYAKHSDRLNKKHSGVPDPYVAIRKMRKPKDGIRTIRECVINNVIWRTPNAARMGPALQNCM